MVLSDLGAGQSAQIVNMQGMEPVMRKKLLNLGFLPKARVELIRFAPMGDSVVIRCANSNIALRKAIINNINVELL